MKEYTGREALMFNIAAKFEKHYGKSREQAIHDFYKCVIKSICLAPAADVVEVRHGRWEERPVNVDTPTTDLFCSECNFASFHWRYNYCPICGAIMDKEE